MSRCNGFGHVHCELADCDVACSECYGTGVIDDDYSAEERDEENSTDYLSMDGIF